VLQKTFPITVKNFGEIGRRSLNILWQNINKTSALKKLEKAKTCKNRRNLRQFKN